MKLRLPLLLAAASLAACESRINVDLATAGFEDARRVEVRVEGVELLDDEGGIVGIEADEPGLVDLLDYQDSALLTVLSDVDIPARRYQGLRLLLDDSDAELETEDGEVVPIRLSGTQPFAPVDFSLGDDDSETLLAVLDLRFSLSDQSDAAGEYRLRQSALAVPEGDAATLAGTVDADYPGQGVCAGVDRGYSIYAYDEERTQPSDFFADSDDRPVASASLLRDEGEDDYRYRIRGLQEGRYTLVFTCQADLDDPLSREALLFREPVVVDADAGRETRRDF